MPLAPSREVFITCAVTGSGDTAGPFRQGAGHPEQIADAAIEAAKAGAAIVAHPRARSRDRQAARATSHLYREVIERIRAADVDVILNLTAGMGGDLMFGGAESAAAA